MDWSIVGPMLGGCAAVASVLTLLGKWLHERATSEGRERARASDAEMQAATAIGQGKMLASEFSLYKERIAETLGMFKAQITALETGQNDTNKRIVISEDRNTVALKELREEVRDLRNDVARLVEKLATRGA